MNIECDPEVIIIPYNILQSEISALIHVLTCNGLLHVIKNASQTVSHIIGRSDTPYCVLETSKF